MSDIKLDTANLRYYGDQLVNIERRIAEVNLHMKTLYGSVRLVDLAKLIQADYLADFNMTLAGCANYCYATADDFEVLEARLSSENPLDFNKPALAGLDEFLYNVVSFVGDSIRANIELTDAFFEGLDNLIQFIDEHGGDILDIVVDVVTVAVAAAVVVGIIVGTGGIGIGAVIAIVAGIYAASNLAEKATGFNIVESGFVGAGSLVGTMCGNANLGAEYGKVAYKGSNIVVDIASLATNPGKAATNGVKYLGKVNKLVGSAQQKSIKFIVHSNERMTGINKGIRVAKNISNKIGTAIDGKNGFRDVIDFKNSLSNTVNANSYLCPVA